MTAAKPRCCRVSSRPAVLGLLLAHSARTGSGCRVCRSSSPAWRQLDAHLHGLQRAGVLLWPVARGAVAISTAISSSSRGTGESNLRVPCRWAGCVTRSGLGDVSGSEGAASQLQREGPREGPRSPHLPAELGVGTRHGGACQPGPREAHAGLTASGRNQICTV